MSEPCAGGGPATFDHVYRRMRGWAAGARVPLHVFFELTPFCNFRCPMCYVRLSPETAATQGRVMSTEAWLALAERLRDLGTFTVTLTGGEPLLHPGFREIYAGLRARGMLVSVFSNGYLLDEETVAVLRACPPRAVKLSLYGASDETYARVCGVPDGFTRVRRAVKLLRAAGVPVHVTATLVKDNVGDLEEMAEFCRGAGVAFSYTAEVDGNARGALSDPAGARLPYEQVAAARPEGRRREDHHAPLTRPFERCRSYGRTCHITWHGRMQVCAYLTHPYASVTDGDAARAWRELLTATDALRLPEVCATCADAAFCRFCPGTLCAESGHPTRVCDSFCHRAAVVRKTYEMSYDEKSIDVSKEFRCLDVKNY